MTMKNGDFSILFLVSFFLIINIRATLTCSKHQQCVLLGECNKRDSFYEKYSTLNQCDVGYTCCSNSNLKRGANGKKSKTSSESCGIPVVNTDPADNYVDLGAIPFLARLGFKSTASGDLKFEDIGTILSEQVILTSARAIMKRENDEELSIVRVGEFNTETDLDCSDDFCGLPLQDIDVKRYLLHPSFGPNDASNNVALIYLTKPIKFSATTQPACLSTEFPEPNDRAITVGWGTSTMSTGPKQQVLNVTVADESFCDKYYTAAPTEKERICVKGDFGHTICEGFDGAPLFLRKQDTYYQVGVLLQKQKGCDKFKPLKYVNLRKIVDWIRANM